MFVEFFTLVCVVMCLSTGRAEHHQPCGTPNMTGIVSMTDLRNPGVMATAEFIYDPLAKKLRMKTITWPPSAKTNASRNLDLLLHFNEGFFYEIDDRNRSCEKKVLGSAVSSMELQPQASFLVRTTVGSTSAAGEGLTMDLWLDSLPQTKGSYYTAVSMRCLPLSTTYISSSSSILVNHFNVDTEIKDPERLNVPSFCEGEAVEETHDGSTHTFFDVLF